MPEPLSPERLAEYRLYLADGSLDPTTRDVALLVAEVDRLTAELADAQRLASVCERQRDEAFALARYEVNRLTAERDGIKTTLHAVLRGRADVDRVLDAAGLGDGDPDGHLAEVVADEGGQAGVVRLLMGQRDEAREQVRRVLALADRLDTNGDEPGDGIARLAAREIRTAVQGDQPAEPTGHVYLSTGCLHGEHGYCQSMTGLAGQKRPGQCKWCSARCVCSCHQGADPASTVDREPASATEGGEG